jgi:hypothetical protein
LLYQANVPKGIHSTICIRRIPTAFLSASRYVGETCHKVGTERVSSAYAAIVDTRGYLTGDVQETGLDTRWLFQVGI